MMTALLSVGAWAKNVWTGSATPESSNGIVQGVEIPSTISLQVGDLIVVTATTPNQYWNQIKVCKTNNNYWAGDVLTTISNYDFESNGSKLCIPVSEAIVSALNSETTPQYTLYFDGYGYTMTSVDIVYGKDNLYTNVNGYEQGYWGGYHLTSELFTLANAGDVLTLDISHVGGDPSGENITICNKEPNSGSEGYTEFATLKAYSVTTVYLSLTNEILTAAKSEGLYIGGGNYKYTSVDLYYGTIKNVNIASMTNGTVTTTKTRATTGATVTLTVTPDGNYELGTLTVTDENNASVAVTPNGDGTYSFTMPATAVTVNATFNHVSAVTLDTENIKLTDSKRSNENDGTVSLWIHETEENGWDLTIGRPVSSSEFSGVKVEYTQAYNVEMVITYVDGTTDTKSFTASGSNNSDVVNFASGKIVTSIKFRKPTSTATGMIQFKSRTAVSLQIKDDATYTTPTTSMKLTYETLEDTGKDGETATVTYDTENKTFTITEGNAHWAFWDFTLPIPTTLYNGIYFNLTQAPAGSAIEIVYADGTVQQESIENEVTSETNFNVDFNKSGNVTRIRFAGAGTYKMGTCTAKPAKYLVTVSAAQYATFGDLGSPDVINYAASGLKAYIAYVNGDKVKLEEVSKATANTAVILYADVNEATSYTINTTDDSADTPSHTNELKISDGTVTGDGSTIYVLANGSNNVGFYRVKSGSPITAGKAYLEVSSGTAPQFIGFGGDTTGINEELRVKSEEFATAQYYDLQGRHVAQPTKGLYIVNGKKVIIK